MVVAGEVGDHPKELQLSAGAFQIIDNARVHGNLNPRCMFISYLLEFKQGDFFGKGGSGLGSC